MKVLVVDCQDSFTYNLCQQIGRLGADVEVVQGDCSPSDLSDGDYDRIILSPGPGRPEKEELCLHILATLSRRVPTLGVCLGHQVICHFSGAEITGAARLVHGRTSCIRHDGTGIFEGVKNPFEATRYHSLAANPETIPPELAVTAVSEDDGTVMAVRHRRDPVFGVQFHPESILSEEGDLIIANFLGGGRTA